MRNCGSRSGGFDTLRVQLAVDVVRDVGPSVIDGDQYVVEVLEAMLDDRDDVGQLRYSNDRPGGGTQQVLVEHHAVGAGDDRAATAADGRAQVHDGAFDSGGHRLVDAQLYELFAEIAPSKLKLGVCVFGVVRVLEIDRCKRSGSGQ